MRARALWMVAAAATALIFSVPVMAGEPGTDEASGQAAVTNAGRQQLILWYGISDTLSSLDVNVMDTGTMLAELQQQGWQVLTI